MYGLPHTTPCQYSSLPARIPFTMKSRLTPHSFRAVTSLRVAPLRFHSPYSAIFSLSDRTAQTNRAPRRHDGTDDPARRLHSKLAGHHLHSRHSHRALEVLLDEREQKKLLLAQPVSVWWTLREVFELDLDEETERAIFAVEDEEIGIPTGSPETTGAGLSAGSPCW